MIELFVATPNLTALFSPEMPNSPMLFAALLGHTPGRIFVDDKINPTQCIVFTNESLIFVSQKANQAFLDETIAHLRESSHIALIWHPSTFTLQIPKADKTLLRLEFSGYNSQALANENSNLPDEFEIHPMDASLLERCEWRAEIESYCGSIDNFLAHGFGICLMHGEEIITEASAPFTGIEKAEIGVVTNENHRGHGYAAITCAALIKLCEERGFEPYWSCDADNAASASLARKLGFQNERDYEIRMYRGIPK